MSASDEVVPCRWCGSPNGTPENHRCPVRPTEDCDHPNRVGCDGSGSLPALPWKCVDCGELCAAPAPFHEIAFPRHYNQGRIQVWDFILDQDLGFLEANVVKYVCRFRHKGAPVKDLEKARAYLDKLIDDVKARGERYGL